MKKIKKILVLMLVAVLLTQSGFAIPSLMMGNYTDTPQMQYAKLRELDDIIRSSHLMSGFNDTPMRNAYELYVGKEVDLSENELRKELITLLEDESFFMNFANLMLHQYDLNSHLLEEEIFMMAYQREHEYEGYGFTLREFGPFFIVTGVYKDSAADKAGLCAGDIIVKVNNNDVRMTKQIKFNELVARSSEKDEEITLTYFNEESPELRNIKISKAPVNIPDVECEIIDDTAVLTISMFNKKQFLSELYKAITKIEESEVENVVIDLRDNPGGYITYCLAVIDSFIAEKDVMMMSEVTRTNKNTHYSTGEGTSFDNVCVLVNENSASSSEILAASLRDNINATVIGTTTYGKCYGQATLFFDKDKYLVLTTSEAVLPKTPNYDHIGLEPDIYVEYDPEYYELPELTALDTEEKITPKSDAEQVIALEERLRLLKYFDEDPDGVYDNKTIEAVNAFQNQAKLSRSSNCSTEMLEKLEEAIENLSKAEVISDNQLETAFSLFEESKAA